MPTFVLILLLLQPLLDCSSVAAKLIVDYRASTPNMHNQGYCGSCYSFASSSAIESVQYRMLGVTVDLSQQQILDCTSTASYGSLGCKGGTPNAAYDFVTRNGLTLDSLYPYQATIGKCSFTNDQTSALNRTAAVAGEASGKTPNKKQTTFYISGYWRVPRGNEAAMSQMLRKHGPIVVAVNGVANSTTFMNFGYNHAPTPIYTDTECNKGIDAEAKHGADPDKHYMLVVGEGYEDGIDYWYLKNSWGVQWGEAGYMRMVKGRNLCGIANEATIPYLIK